MGWYNWKQPEYRSSDPPGRPLRPGESLWSEDDEEDRRSVPVYSAPEYVPDNTPHHELFLTPVKVAFPETQGLASDYKSYVERLQSLFEAYFLAIGQKDASSGGVGVFCDKLRGFIESLDSDKSNPLRILQRLTILESQLVLIELEIASLERANKIILETRRKHERVAAFLEQEDPEAFRLTYSLFESRSQHTRMVAHVDILIGIWNAADDFFMAVRKEPWISQLTEQQEQDKQPEAVPSDPSRQTLRGFLFELFDQASGWKSVDGPINEHWSSAEHRYRQVPASERRQLINRLKAYENSLRNVQPQPGEKRLPSRAIEFLCEMRKSIRKDGIVSQALIQMALLHEPDDSKCLGVTPEWSEPVALRRQADEDQQDSGPEDLSRRVLAAICKLVG